MDNISIRYWLDNKEFAARSWHRAPLIGDEIRFNGEIYKVEARIWIEDEEIFDCQKVRIVIKRA